MQLYLVLALFFAITIAIFAVQNAILVDINFFIYQFHNISLVVVILASALFGALVIFLLSLFKQMNCFRKTRGLEKRNEVLEKELESLRHELTKLKNPVGVTTEIESMNQSGKIE